MDGMLFLERKSTKKNFHALSNPLRILDFCPVTIVRFLSRNRIAYYDGCNARSKEMKCDEIFTALDLLEKERGISPTFMMDKIIQALTTAYKKDHEGVENVIVDVDEARKDLRMYVQKEIVAEVERPGAQISLEDALLKYRRADIGGLVNIPVDNVEFGRIAAGNGKQVIIQGLREAERGMVYDEFNSKQHEILTGEVSRIDPRSGGISLRIGAGPESTEAMLAASEQIKGEELVEGQHVKVYVVEVRRSTRGPQVLISRTHPGLVRRLFELEVPEIYDGMVEVKSIAREAGSRTKMAVWSSDEAIDPIGACVGPAGQRVNSIVSELGGEKIDIIKYSEDPAQFIAAAIAPADVIEVLLAEEGKACRVIVPDDQLSLAIGKEGQNARLAARLTGYKIDIKPQSFQEDEKGTAGHVETT
jgi:N utilization substance protein A